MNKLKISILVAGIFCAAAIATACTNETTDTHTTAAEETTKEATEPTTEKETEPMTDNEIETTPVTEEESTEPATEAVTEEVTTEAETECHLLFEDDFDGDTLDATKWKVGTTEDQPTVQYNTALWDPSMVALDGEGHLVLTSEWDSEARGARSGAVITKGTFEAGYGYYEASIQFPLIYGRSNHFSIVTENASIDIMRSENGLKKVFYEHRLTQGETVQTLDALRAALVNVYDGRFHTFGVLRSAEGHTFYVDGRETGFVPATDFSATNENGYLALFWEALKTDGAGRGSEGKFDIPAEMIIDRVRVYSSLPETFDKAENAEATLVFNDDFDGVELDSTKWEKCPEWERQGKSQWKNDLSYVDGEGNLILKMDWNKDTQLVDCGAVRTLGRFAYGYGYYEARIRFTSHYGAWGAFWMMCGRVSSETGGATDGVEIDVIESIDNQNGAYNHNLHWDGYGQQHKAANPALITKNNVYDGEYHTFGVHRSETGYAFYIDGHLSSIVPYASCEPCPEDGYIKLTCESAAWSGGGTDECIDDMPAQMIVDYVRVWDSVPDLNP